MTRELPQFLRDLLASPPRAGEGVHAWLFRVARQLHAHMPAGEIVALLETRVANRGRLVPRHEIISAVQNSLACAWQPSQSYTSKPIAKWPVVNREQVGAIVREGYGLADLWEASRVRLEDNEAHTEEIVDRLFPGNPLLCCGRSQSDFDTKPREDWRGELAKLQFIVPNPMSALTGTTKEGKESAHALSNTGPRRFLVCEFDTGTTDQHAALLLHLATFAPLVCVVHSGGKSLHGWFYVHSQPEERILRFMRYAVSLGADPATWTRSQFVRMPDGTRDNGRRQTVFLLSLRPLGIQE
ncbi:MAG: hypothetical protein HYY24_22140 [Verrucomicrobia bacterium]|nr:hypothetical protein [Verrucomicrobiota bacterium]